MKILGDRKNPAVRAGVNPTYRHTETQWRSKGRTSAKTVDHSKLVVSPDRQPLPQLYRAPPSASLSPHFSPVQVRDYLTQRGRSAGALVRNMGTKVCFASPSSSARNVGFEGDGQWSPLYPSSLERSTPLWVRRQRRSWRRQECDLSQHGNDLTKVEPSGRSES